MKGLVWLRRDLRLRANPALSAACQECQEIVPLFVFDEPLLRSHAFGSACVGFMLGCLEELRRSLALHGVVAGSAGRQCAGRGLQQGQAHGPVGVRTGECLEGVVALKT